MSAEEQVPNWQGTICPGQVHHTFIIFFEFPASSILTCPTLATHRHDLPNTSGTVLRETRLCEGTFSELRASGAPEEGPAYTDADATSAVFQVIVRGCDYVG